MDNTKSNASGWLMVGIGVIIVVFLIMFMRYYSNAREQAQKNPDEMVEFFYRNKGGMGVGFFLASENKEANQSAMLIFSEVCALTSNAGQVCSENTSVRNIKTSIIESNPDVTIIEITGEIHSLKVVKGNYEYTLPIRYFRHLVEAKREGENWRITRILPIN